jgi:hypothetical protein
MGDTSMDIEKRYRDMIMAKTPEERLRMASRMFDSARKLVIAGILRERPNLSESQLRARLFLRMYERDFSAVEIQNIIRKIPDMQLDQ